MKRTENGALNVRVVNSVIGTPNDKATDNTIVGLLKSIVKELTDNLS